MEFPAQYMFKDVPDVVEPGTDPVQWIVEKMDAFGIEQCMTGLNDALASGPRPSTPAAST